MKRLLVLLLAASPALADPPQITYAAATRTGATWRFEVTLRHPDTGWEHYADGWRIETPDGAILGTRDLLHPHVAEQPFTRSLGGVAIAPGTTTVLIRARCLVDGWSATTTPLRLDQ